MAQLHTCLPHFASLDDARQWMYDLVDDSCVDNGRAALACDDAAMESYWAQAEQGCCGSFDRRVVADGQEWFIGCNYGH